MIITIDGPAGTGKSTIAKELGKQLGLRTFDTGAMYRALTLLLLEKQIAFTDAAAIERELTLFSFEVKLPGPRFVVCGKDVTEAIRSQEVTKNVSEVAALGPVREALVHIQRRFAESGSCIFEGRDMGSVVFPKAECKIYLNASPLVRAKRRHAELVAKQGSEAPPLATVLADIEARDLYDSSRKHSPLVKPKDAVEIDTSNLTINEIVNQIVKLIN